jgi:hypothetical protein
MFKCLTFVKLHSFISSKLCRRMEPSRSQSRKQATALMLKTLAGASLCILISGMLQTFTGCGQQSRWNNEDVVLEQRAIDLERRHRLLNQSIDSLWDATSFHLAHAIPAGFPPLDSALFVNARNADHIRMFMSFDLLDAETQAIVNAAGAYDQRLAAQIHGLIREKQEFLAQKNTFLQKVAETSLTESQRLAARLRDISSAQIEN